MSRDIRSFFTVISKSPGSDSKQNKPSLSLNKKKPKKLVESDDENVVAATPEKKPSKKLEKRQVVVSSSDAEDENSKKKAKSPKKTEKPVNQKRHLVILSSDSEDEDSKSKAKIPKKSEPQETSSKLKPATIEDVFKNVPVKQSKVEYTPKPTVEKKSEGKQTKKSKSNKQKRTKTELGIHDDPAFEKTLAELDDDDIFEKSIDILEQSLLQEEENNKNVKEHQKESTETKNKSESSISPKEEEPKVTERKRSRTDSSSDRNTPKKQKLEHVDSGIDPGQEKHEKKRYSAMLYQKYLNRGDPKHHGMKELPKGKEGCLNNLCFLRTGVLDSLKSEEFESLVTGYGGRIVQAVSKKVNYIVVGDEPGPAKLAKAQSYNIKQIDEDELFDLILVKSGLEPKYCKKDTSLSSEDLGIEVDSKETSPTEKKKIDEPKKENSEKINTKSPKKDESKIEIKTEKEIKHSPNKPGTSKSPEKVQQTEKIQTEVKNEHIKTNIDPSSLSLADKYKPKEIKEIIGQFGEKSEVGKLRKWLKEWRENQRPEKRKTLKRPTPWDTKDDGAYFKCALLSGPPGVGKTTTATLVAKDLGLDIVEFNASDTRSKRLLHEEVSQLLSSNTIAGYAAGQQKVTKNRVLLMDEVDGMAGNEDRGGMQELIQLIKNSNIPIICTCNDRNHQKMRSLLNYCYDIKFNRPKPEQITGAMMTVCFREKINITAPALKEIVVGLGCDMRQILNHLSLLAVSGNQVSVEQAKNEANKAKKDTVMGPWEVCRKIFTESEHKNMSVADKARLFFYDYSLGPLFVQENYLKAQPTGDKKKQLLTAALAADSISRGDIIDAKIRSNNNWALLESQAMFSSVLPGFYRSGQINGQINFPSWLGKNSKKNKFSRIISEIQMHTRTSTSASKMAVRLDYLDSLRDAILKPLKLRGMEGIDEAVEFMKMYNLLREDFDNLLELCQWNPGESNPFTKIDFKVKSAFTRTYNKRVTLLPYASVAGITKKKASTAKDDLYGDEEDDEESDNNEDDDISNNAMIKVKKPAGKGKKTNEEAGSSKAKENQKGKGKGKKTNEEAGSSQARESQKGKGKGRKK